MLTVWRSMPSPRALVSGALATVAVREAIGYAESDVDRPLEERDDTSERNACTRRKYPSTS
jgi:hypothetical protein